MLHTVGYEDGGRVRPILHRASVSEMVVPYGDPGPMHGWKNAFDAGEWGLGRMANSLTLGCDCLGLIHYFDVDVRDRDGRARSRSRTRSACTRRTTGSSGSTSTCTAGTTEVRRSRRLVVSSIATVGNYEYGFYWYFYLDGTIQLEVKLTGIMSTMAVRARRASPTHASMVAPQLAAPVPPAPVQRAPRHRRRRRAQHGATRSTRSPTPPGPDNPLGQRLRDAPRPRSRTEQQAKRLVDPARSRTWKIVNPDVRNGLGQPVAYKLVPGATPTLLADPDSSVGRRAGVRHPQPVGHARTDPTSAAPRATTRTSTAAATGSPRGPRPTGPIVDTDLVVWHTFGVTHIPRPEDWPVMPVEYAGFHLVPFGFFDRNPALDVAPTDDHCSHS